MAQAQANGITLEYELSGPEDGQPLLLVHGVGAQLVRWPDPLLDALAAAGFRLIRFDNRDVGLSTHVGDAGVPDFAALSAAKARGEPFALPYTLADMAADAFGLLDALGISRAHVMGVSLGGMIAQQMAIADQGRLLSLVVVMSQSGNPDLPLSDPAAMAALQRPAPDPRRDREAFLAHSVALNREVGSPAYPTPEANLRRFAALAADRAYDPPGAARQLAAGRLAPDRREGLGRLAVPTLVIHGADDRLVLPPGGEDVARSVPNSWLMMIRGMGHDLPDQLCAPIAAMVALNAGRPAGAGAAA